MPVPGRPHLTVLTRASRSIGISRKFAPSGIWLSILRPSPAHPWQDWQLPFCRNSWRPAAMSSGDCAYATGPLASPASTAKVASPPLTRPWPVCDLVWDLGICAPPRSRLIIQGLVIRCQAREEALPGLFTHAGQSVRPILCIAVFLSALVQATAQQLRRATLWDLKLGEPIAAQPSPDQFRGFACGSNGGAPRQPLTRWRDFARCRAGPAGLHEVYFGFHDELEYIARARDAEREITRWAGTTEVAFPVVVSALFDSAGVLRGIRMVTDARPDHRNDITEANLRKRADAYLLGGIMAARFDIMTAH